MAEKPWDAVNRAYLQCGSARTPDTHGKSNSEDRAHEVPVSDENND